MLKHKFHLLRSFWPHINHLRRKQLGLLLILTFLSSLAEVVSLSAILPFISVIINPDKVFLSPWLVGFIEFFKIESTAELVVPLAIGFAFSAIIAGTLRLILLWFTIIIGKDTGLDIGVEVYRRTLYQDYSIHTGRNSSAIISNITQKVGTTSTVLVSLISVVTSTTLSIVIIATLIAVDPIGVVLIVAVFGGAYWMLALCSRNRLEKNSIQIAHEQTQVIKLLQEGLGSIRDILLSGTQKIYYGSYQKAITRLQHAVAENAYISQAPRYVMEALGIVIFAFLVIISSNSLERMKDILPILAIFALGAQRLLPLIHQLYGNWSVVCGSNTALTDVLLLLQQPIPESCLSESKTFKFSHSIQFQKVSFRYDKNSPWILQDIDLIIYKGNRVGIIGDTGCAKSTTIDLMIGLLKPTNGKIIVDKNFIDQSNLLSWQRNIAHVPQSIFLSDTSFKENIAFGIPPDKIDMYQVIKVAKQAKIHDFIESQNDKYDTNVGEHGIRLSGGQRQRIGIARALYKQASVIIFDEATSALDDKTEKEIMQTIDNLENNLTFFIITHKISNLKNCDVILKLEKNKKFSLHTYQTL